MHKPHPLSESLNRMSKNVNNTGEEEEKSSNPEFKELLKSAFQYIQAVHHFENWNEIPERINKSIDNIIQLSPTNLNKRGTILSLPSRGDPGTPCVAVARGGHVLVLFGP